MVGYSRLMEADERGTITRQKAYRAELIDPKIADHHGRIVKTTGDGLLVEFASVVDAVESALAIQGEMAEREADIPEDRRIRYRVGINLGDIVIDDDDIFGDGVNVAARLQETAEQGGIAISGTVYEHVLGKLDIAFSDAGQYQVKNITRPIHVWQWHPPALSKDPRSNKPRWERLRTVLRRDDSPRGGVRGKRARGRGLRARRSGRCSGQDPAPSLRPSRTSPW